MLAPAAPHITDELWSRRLAAAGEPWSSIHTQAWPEVDVAADAPRRPARSRSRSTASCATGSRSRPTPTKSTLEKLVLASPKVVAALAGRTPDRVIHAGGKLVNIVVRD